jgi:DNA-directed RNA polymerase subunit RPC12/RpoP
MTEEDKIEEILHAAETGGPLPEGVYVHVSHTPTQADWDALDLNSRETSCADCGEGYSGVFATLAEATEFMCPNCGSRHTTGIASPAGAMSLIHRSDWS